MPQPDIIIKHIQIRTATAQNWSIDNPILLLGEQGYVVEEVGGIIVLSKFKVGNGVSNWNDLPYFQGIPGPSGTTPISQDNNNRLTVGQDQGLFVPDLVYDLLAAYNAAKT